MSRILLSTVSTVALGLMIGSADPAKADPMAGAPQWEFYLGAHGGAGWLDGKFGTVPFKTDIDLDRGIFGALAGINWRQGYWLFGLEADVGFFTNSKIKGLLCSGGLVCKSSMNYHFRARVGRMVTPNIDLFGAVGVALMHVKFNEFGTKHKKTMAGLSLGAGADIKVGSMPGGMKPIVRIEALYDIYGKQNFGAFYGAKNWDDFTVRAAFIFPF